MQVEANTNYSIIPSAIKTIAGLLTRKSGYIRLDAAKEILCVNGIGQSRDAAAAQPLLISIQIGNKNLGESSAAAGGASLDVGRDPAGVMANDSAPALAEGGSPRTAAGEEPAALPAPPVLEASVSEPLSWDLDE